MSVTVHPPIVLDAQGRCCGRKPMKYKTRQNEFVTKVPYLFCPRCDAAFDPDNGRQIENSHYREYDGGFMLRSRFGVF